MKKLKVGLAGCGRISGKHLEAIEEIKELDIVSLCDCDELKLVPLKDKYKDVHFYKDYDKMLENEDIDIISICTPSGLHSEMGIKAARKKITVVTEKPISTKVEDAESLINECIKNEVKLFVIKQNRLNSTIRLLKQAVDKGRFGRLFMINSNVLWNRTQEYYDMSPWRGTRAMDGGVFLNQGSHYVDVVQWLGGKVKSVSALTKTFNHNIEMEDSGAAVLEFESGAIGCLNMTVCVYRKNWEGSISIIGEDGTAKVGGVAVNKIEYWDFKKYEDEDKTVFQQNYNPPNVYGFGHLGYYENIVKDIMTDNRDSSTVDGEEGKKSLEIIMAIYESAKTGKKVKL